MSFCIYLDEDSMQRGLIDALRLREVDVLTALEAGMIERRDEDHLQFAASQRRVLFSFNVSDYCRLDSEFRRAGRFHAGIILARQQQLSIGEHLRRLLKLRASRTEEEMSGRIEFLSNWA